MTTTIPSHQRYIESYERVAWRSHLSLTIIVVGLLLAACSAKSSSSNAQQSDACASTVFDGLLQKYVHDGRVNYASLKATKADLDAFDAYLREIGKCDLSTLVGHAQEAFWVNAYNAFNIKGVLDHWPTDNIKSIDGFLDKKTWHVANLNLTLNDIEYKHVIPARKDARNHFAVDVIFTGMVRERLSGRCAVPRNKGCGISYTLR